MKTLVNDTAEYSFASPRSVQSYSDYRHDSLVRCKDCKFKYDISECSRTVTGQFVCKFCIKQNGVKNV